MDQSPRKTTQGYDTLLELPSDVLARIFCDSGIVPFIRLMLTCRDFYTRFHDDETIWRLFVHRLLLDARIPRGTFDVKSMDGATLRQIATAPVRFDRALINGTFKKASRDNGPLELGMTSYRQCLIPGGRWLVTIDETLVNKIGPVCYLQVWDLHNWDTKLDGSRGVKLYGGLKLDGRLTSHDSLVIQAGDDDRKCFIFWTESVGDQQLALGVASFEATDANHPLKRQTSIELGSNETFRRNSLFVSGRMSLLKYEDAPRCVVADWTTGYKTTLLLRLPHNQWESSGSTVMSLVQILSINERSITGYAPFSGTVVSCFSTEPWYLGPGSENALIELELELDAKSRVTVHVDEKGRAVKEYLVGAAVEEHWLPNNGHSVLVTLQDVPWHFLVDASGTGATVHSFRQCADQWQDERGYSQTKARFVRTSQGTLLRCHPSTVHVLSDRNGTVNLEWPKVGRGRFTEDDSGLAFACPFSGTAGLIVEDELFIWTLDGNEGSDTAPSGVSYRLQDETTEHEGGLAQDEDMSVASVDSGLTFSSEAEGADPTNLETQVQDDDWELPQ